MSTNVAGLPAVTQALARDIDAKLRNTPMRGTGAAFVEQANRHDINPWFLVSIAGAESQYGATGFATNGSHNPFGLGVTGAAGAGMRFSSWNAAIAKAAQTLDGPIYQGRDTINDIGAKWAADPQWANKVARIYGDLTGSTFGPANRVKGASRSVGGQEGGPDIIEDIAGWDPIQGVLDVLKFITNPAMWLRIGQAILGTIIGAFGVWAVIKGSSGGKPLGVLAFSLGLLFVIGAVKGVTIPDAISAFVGG